MGTRPLSWLVAAPLMGCAALAAHELAYLALGAAQQDTLHGYLSHLPYAGAVAAALLAIGLFLRARAARASEAALPLRAALFAIVPLLAFAVQEHVELAAAGGGGLALAEPTFVAGLLLQIPVGLIAYFCGCALLGVAERLGRRRRARPGPSRGASYLAPAVAGAPCLHVPRARPQRGPPR